ncbi:unnamed protein product [Toxocara canis]|uniref:DUF2179 domain-containing protein n=1 Tax=Toxocara canis TaxID=6265 RepID=A0A183VGG0_TOXCA|nr:unnamed protein product [Toxocara canis]
MLTVVQDGAIKALLQQQKESPQFFHIWYHPVIGTLVTVDVYSNVSSTAIKRTIERAVRGGHIGRFAVSNEGFQFHVVKGDCQSHCF